MSIKKQKTADNKFKTAFRASNLSQIEMAELTKLSGPTICARKDYPGQFRLEELKQLYDEMNDVGKQILLEAVNEFFLAERLS